MTVPGISESISSWKDIISTERKGQLTVHGHLDKATFGLAYFIEQTFGKAALAQYARNIADIKHFSQLIKNLGSTNKNRTAFCLLPDVAVSKIPSTKKIRILNLKEGKILSPMVLMVKQSKRDQCKEILEKFWSRSFYSMLYSGGCIMPDKLDESKNYFLPDFTSLATDFDRIEQELDACYLNNLAMHEIKKKSTIGGVCK